MFSNMVLWLVVAKEEIIIFLEKSNRADVRCNYFNGAV